MAIVRSTVIAYMRKAFRTGQSVTAFREDMRRKGLSYRWTTMLSDWASVNQIEQKTGRMRYIRKDRYPAKQVMAEVDWLLSSEYMYKVRVQSQIRPDIPTTERFVNIMSDVPMTAAMVEQAVTEMWVKWEDYTAEELGKLVVETAVHRSII